MRSQQVNVHGQMAVGARLPSSLGQAGGGGGGGVSLIDLLCKRDGARLYHVSLRLQVFVWEVKSPSLECQTVFLTVSYLSLSSVA